MDLSHPTPATAAVLRLLPIRFNVRTPYRAVLLAAGAEDGPPLASAELGPFPLEGVEGQFNDFRAGVRRASVRLANVLARWLFGAETPALNAVGAALRELAGSGLPVRPVRLTVALHKDFTLRPDFRECPLALLGQNEWLPLRVVRRIDGARPVGMPRLQVAGRLRVLVVHANPAVGSDPLYPHLPDLPRCVVELKKAFDPLIHGQGLLIVKTLPQPTAAELKEHLAEFRPHVLVFLGHGYDIGTGGLVCLEGGRIDLCHFPELVAALGTVEERALRLAVLIACDSQAAAPLMLEAGVPAVVAMDAKIDLASVFAFNGPFLGAIARFRSLTEAHDAGCQAMAASDTPIVVAQSALPALWLATAEDQLFAPAEERFLAVYRDALLKEVGSIDLPGVTVDLDAVYVDRTLMKEVKEEKPPAPGRDEAARAVAREVIREEVEVDLWEALAKKTLVVVEAAAWIGKTTLCRRVVTRLLDPATDRDPPIYLRFRDWAENWARSDGLRKPLDQYIAENYFGGLHLRGQHTVDFEDAGTVKTLPAATWLYYRWKAAEALLVVDGLDEVYDVDRRANALNALITSAESQSQARILLTTRPIGLGAVEALCDPENRITLQELDRDGIKSLATSCGRVLRAPDRAARFLERLNDPDATSAFDTARRPGLLVRMVDAFVNKGVFLTAREEVLDWEVEDRLDPDRPARVPLTTKPIPPGARYKRAVLEELAFHLLFCHTDRSPGEGEMVDLVSLIMSGVRDRGKPYPAYTDPPSQAVTLLADLVQNSGMLQQVTLAVEEARERGVSADAPCYQFETAEVQQFLAACHLKRCLEPDGPTLADLDPPPHAGALRAWVHGRWWSRLGRLVGRTRGVRLRWPTPRPTIDLPPFSWYLERTAWHDVVVWLGGVLDDSSALLGRLGREPDDVARLTTRLRFRILARSRSVAPRLVRRANRTWLRAVREGSDEEITASLARPRVREHVALETLLRIAEHHADGSTRMRACDALGALADPRALETLLRIAEHHASEFTRMCACNALGALADPRALETLLRIAEHHADKSTRWHAYAVLGKRADPRALETLLRIAEHDADRSTRGSACDALGAVADPRALETLLRIAEHDADGFTRGSACDALGERADPRALETLLLIAEHDADGSARRQARKALAAISRATGRVIRPK